MQQPNSQYLNQQPYGARAPQQNPGPNQFMRPPQQNMSGYPGQTQHMQPHNSHPSQGSPFQGA